MPDYRVTTFKGGRFLVEALSDRARKAYARRGPEFRWLFNEEGLASLKQFAATVRHGIEYSHRQAV